VPAADNRGVAPGGRRAMDDDFTDAPHALPPFLGIKKPPSGGLGFGFGRLVYMMKA